MEECWIWYGPEDRVTLEDIRQSGAAGLSTALYSLEAGVAWPLEEIEARKRTIEEAGLRWVGR